MSETEHLLAEIQPTPTTTTTTAEDRQPERIVQSLPLSLSPSPSLSVLTQPLSQIRHRNNKQLMAGGVSEHTGSSSSSSMSHDPIPGPSGGITRYGTLQSSSPPSGSGVTLKQRSMVDNRYPRAYFTRRQFFIAAISMTLFIAAVAVTLIFGLPRLEAKREQYFAAEFYSSPIPEEVNNRWTILVSNNEYPDCVNVGRDVLIRKNGSVMDAALACLLCTTLSSPHLVGFDSGFRGLIKSNQTIYSFEAPERIFRATNQTVTYPVMPFAMKRLHRRFGKISWHSIVQPSIELAENGTKISSQLVYQLQQNPNIFDEQLKSIREFFMFPNTTEFLKVGQKYRNPILSKTLESLATSTTTSNISAALFDELTIEQIKSILNDPTVDDPDRLISFLTDNTDETVKIDRPLQFTMLNETVKVYSGRSDPVVRAMEHMLKLSDRLIQSDPMDQETKSLKRNAQQFNTLLDIFQFGFVAYLKLQSSQYANNDSNVNNDNDNNSGIFDDEYLDSIAEKLLNEQQQQSYSPRNESFYGLTPEMITGNGHLLNKLNQSNNNVQVTVHDIVSGDIVTLTTSRRNSLFQGKKLILSNGLILDVFDITTNTNTSTESILQESITPWPLLIQNHKDGMNLTIGGVGGCGSLQTSFAMIQVLNKILLNHQTLKTSIDESRLYYRPPNDLIYEIGFPQAYIDLLTRMFGRTNLIANIEQQQQHGEKWIDSAVYAVMSKSTTTTNRNNQIISMVDFRLDGSISGI